MAAFRMLLLAAVTTALLALAVLALSSAIGLAVAFCRLYAPRPIRLVLAGLIAVIRGVPLLVLLIGSYFSLPYLGLDLPLYGVAILVMGLYFAAYMTEVFRGAIAAVPRGQWEAGRSLGLRWWVIAALIILPQARRLAMAPYLNTALSIVKNTSLVSAIGGWELAAAGSAIGDRSGDLLSAYLAVAAGYFLLCLPLSRLAAWAERAQDGVFAPRTQS
jgi:polar amino acid transport system permease protein